MLHPLSSTTSGDEARNCADSRNAGLKRLCHNFCRPYGVCVVAVPPLTRLSYFSHWTAGLRPRLKQMSPLRGLVNAKFDRLLHRSAPIAAMTQTPTGLGLNFPLYPGLNHPNTRKNGARWGPRYALGYHCSALRAGFWGGVWYSHPTAIFQFEFSRRHCGARILGNSFHPANSKRVLTQTHSGLVPARFLPLSQTTVSEVVTQSTSVDILVLKGRGFTGC